MFIKHQSIQKRRERRQRREQRLEERQRDSYARAAEEGSPREMFLSNEHVAPVNSQRSSLHSQGHRAAET